MFTELKKLIAKRSLTITVAVLDNEQVRVNMGSRIMEPEVHDRNGNLEQTTGYPEMSRHLAPNLGWQRL